MSTHPIIVGGLSQATTTPGARRRWRAFAALTIGVLCIAWSGPLVVWSNVPGPASAFYRVIIAAVVLVPWRLAHPRPLPGVRSLAIAAAAGCCFALDLGLFNSAVLRSSAAMATLLGNTAPVLVGLGAYVLFGERQPMAFWLGLALAGVGCATLVGGDALNPAKSTTLDGDVMALSAALFYAAYLLITGRSRTGVDTLTFTAVAVVASAATSLLVCLILQIPLGVPSANSPHALRAWGALIGLGLVSQLGGYLAITYALGHLPTTVVAVTLLAQPPLTALLAVPLLGERLSPLHIAGGTIVLIGIGVVNARASATEGAG